jgi:hypothetical protein
MKKTTNQINEETFNTARERDAIGREDKLYMESLEFSRPKVSHF